MHQNRALSVTEKAFVRLNALRLSSKTPKVRLPFQFTDSGTAGRYESESEGGRGDWDPRTYTEDTERTETAGSRAKSPTAT